MKSRFTILHIKINIFSYNLELKTEWALSIQLVKHKMLTYRQRQHQNQKKNQFPKENKHQHYQ